MMTERVKTYYSKLVEMIDRREPGDWLNAKTNHQKFTDTYDHYYADGIESFNIVDMVEYDICKYICWMKSYEFQIWFHWNIFYSFTMQ